MKIIIAWSSRKRLICAGVGSKLKYTGSFEAKDNDTKIMKFVACPKCFEDDLYIHKKPEDDFCIHKRPDDMSDDGRTWRRRLRDYNENYKNTGENPDNLLPACELYSIYKKSAYKELVAEFGIENVFILSAGWGLIRADYLTPIYDITVSNEGKPHSKIEIEDALERVPNMLPDDEEDIIFLGGQNYQELFSKLVSGYKGKKTIFYSSKKLPPVPSGSGFELKFYEPEKDGIWYYECAEKICKKGGIEDL